MSSDLDLITEVCIYIASYLVATALTAWLYRYDLKGEAIMFINLSIVLLANPINLPIILTDFTCFLKIILDLINAHGITNS